ncbi:YncE family protein [Parvularcula maris]|uniref:Beta-propeller fold lactonase family protein n=1 Tax=Parvularcula maris TaxID=2965077 RepID=A0A9X2RIM4_9PROT|nr:YncE family protein [Parvularcula maris]MCQ8186164.1 beta-propeller fold lactonase family protein [Parvularcula maris]
MLRPLALTTALLTAPAAAETLIVGNKAEDTVSFIDLETGEERARLETGRYPHEIAVSPDGSTAVVVSYRGEGYNGRSLHVFDVADATKSTETKLGGAAALHGLKWIPGTDSVIVTAEATKNVAILNPTRDGRRAEYISTDQDGSHMVAVSPDGSTAYVANIASGSFTVVDIATAMKVHDVEAGEGTEAIAVSPDGKRLFVGNNGSKNVMVFDAQSYEKVGEFATKGVPIRVEISPDGATLAISEFDRGEVTFYDAQSFEKEGSVRLGRRAVPVTLLYAPDGSKLWAAATGEATIYEIDTESRKVLRKLKAGEGSDGLGYSPL